jgi:hypothetical protein
MKKIILITLLLIESLNVFSQRKDTIILHKKTHLWYETTTINKNESIKYVNGNGIDKFEYQYENSLNKEVKNYFITSPTDCFITKDIHFIPIMDGMHDYILKTTDGGATYSRIDLEKYINYGGDIETVSCDITKLFFVNEKNGSVLVHNTYRYTNSTKWFSEFQFLYTNNGGETWSNSYVNSINSKQVYNPNRQKYVLSWGQIRTTKDFSYVEVTDVNNPKRKMFTENFFQTWEVLEK